MLLQFLDNISVTSSDITSNFNRNTSITSNGVSHKPKVTGYSQFKRQMVSQNHVIQSITDEFKQPELKKKSLKMYTNKTQLVKNEVNGPFQITKVPFFYREVSKQRVKKIPAQELQSLDLQKFTISKRSHFSLDQESEIEPKSDI